MLLEETSAIPFHQQRLVFHGKQMADSRTLEEYGIHANSLLHMVLGLHGGEGSITTIAAIMVVTAT